MNKIKVIVYSNVSNKVQNFLKNIDNKKNKIIVENFEDFMLKDSYINQGNLIVIENDSQNNGLELYKIIKNKSIIQNIPIVFIGADNMDLKLQVLKLGALDYLEEHLDKTIFTLKMKKYIEIVSNMTLYIEDSLTETYSNIYGERLLKEEFEYSRERKQSLCLLLLEINVLGNNGLVLNKSKINDIMVKTVTLFKHYLENRNFIYRISNRRFMIVFSDKTIVEVLKIGNEIIETSKDINDEENNVSIVGSVELLEEFDKNIEYFIERVTTRLKKGKDKEQNKIYIEDVDENIAKNNILIVDEDKVLLKVLSSRYKNKGFNVKTVEDVDEVTEVLKNNSIDLIISSYIVSGVKITELIREIKEKHKNIHILVFSSQKNEFVIEEVLSMGGDDYIEKPFSPVELDARVNKLMK